MTGIIWFVQIVHYPLFLLVPDPHHAAFAHEHQRRTGWIVAPLMILELLSAIAFLHDSWRPAIIAAREAWAGVLVLAAIWVSTFWLQVPCHEQLLRASSPAPCKRLVRTNWIRTVAWTIRAALVIYWTNSIALHNR